MGPRVLQNLGFRGSDWVGREGFETLLYNALHKVNRGIKQCLGELPLIIFSVNTEY